jgi:hypothetical protein
MRRAMKKRGAAFLASAGEWPALPQERAPKTTGKRWKTEARMPLMGTQSGGGGEAAWDGT